VLHELPGEGGRLLIVDLERRSLGNERARFSLHGESSKRLLQLNPGNVSAPIRRITTSTGTGIVNSHDGHSEQPQNAMSDALFTRSTSGARHVGQVRPATLMA
jgi:hypothetical protein